MVLQCNKYSVLCAIKPGFILQTHGNLLTCERLGQEHNATRFQTSVLAGVESSASRWGRFILIRIRSENEVDLTADFGAVTRYIFAPSENRTPVIWASSQPVTLLRAIHFRDVTEWNCTGDCYVCFSLMFSLFYSFPSCLLRCLKHQLCVQSEARRMCYI